MGKEPMNMSLTYCAKVTAYEKVNDQLTRCKCLVQALGKNRNFSYFSKEVVEKALPTIYNIPVIGHLNVNDAGNLYMGGHDVAVHIDGGNIDLENLCVPYGVVPVQDGAHFETLKEPNGVEREYLAIDVILWTGRYAELLDAVYSDTFYFNQSMEITISDWGELAEDTNYTEVKDFQYSALCLLGKADDVNSKEHTEPCFPLASVVPYEYSMQSALFTDLTSQLKNELASCFIQENSEEGGNKLVMSKETSDAILKEFNITAEDIDFEITEEMTEDELRQAAMAFIEAHSEEQITEPETNEPDEVPEEKSFSMTYRDRMNALYALLPDETVEDENGNVVSEITYWINDFDDNYVYVERWTWTPESYENKCGRYPVRFDEAENTVELAGDFEEMVVRWLTAAEDAELNRMRNENEELRAYRSMREEQDLHSAMDAVLSEFVDIEGTEEFAAICENPYSYDSVEALRNACFAARGMVTQPKVKPTSELRQPLGGSFGSFKENNGRYGDLFDRYGRKNTNN